MKKFLQKLTLSFGFFIPITGLNIEEELNINKDLSGSYKLHTWYNKDDIGMYLGPDQIIKAYPNKESYAKEFGNDSVQNLKCDEEVKGSDMNFTMSFDFKDIKQIPPFANITFSEDKSSCTVARKIEFSEKDPDKTVLKGFKYNFKLTLPGKATETTEGYAEGWSMDLPDLVSISELKAKYAKAEAAPAVGEVKTEGNAEGEKPKEDKKEGMSTGLLIGIGAGALAVIGAVVFIFMKKQKAKEQERLARLQAEEEDGEEGGVPARPSSRFRKPTTRGTVKNTSARLQRPAAGRPGSRPSRPSVPPPIDIDEEESPQEEEIQQEEAPPQPQPKPQLSPVRRPQAPPVPPRPSAPAPAPAPQGAEPMKIIQCPKCQTKLKVKTSLKGKPVQCPKCKNKMIVP